MLGAVGRGAWRVRAFGRLVMALWLGVAGIAVCHAGTVTCVYTDPQGTLTDADANKTSSRRSTMHLYVGSQALGARFAGADPQTRRSAACQI